MGARVSEANDLSAALRDDGMQVAYSPVESAGRAALDAGDLIPAFLPHCGSTLNHTLGFHDDKLTDLQRDLIYWIAVPLRTGLRLVGRAIDSKWLRPFIPLLKRLRKRPSSRLQSRRP